MTVAEIEAEVTANLNREDVAEVATRVGTWVQAELRAWAEQAVWPPAQAGRTRVGQPHNWSFLRSTYDFNTVVGHQTYNLPLSPAFLRPVRLWFETVASDRIQYLDLEVLKQSYYGRSNAHPECYGIEFQEDDATAAVLWVFPPPLQVWAGHLTYQRKATAISGAQSNIFTIRWPDGIIAGATARGLRLVRGHAEAEAWESQRNVILGAAIASDRRAESEVGMTLGISTVADGDPDNARPILSDYPTDRKIDPASYY